MENIRIKATPQALFTGALDVQDTVSSIRSHFSDIEAAVKRSSAYWQGDAANSHRAVYEEMKEDVDGMFIRLLEHTADLKSMAKVYLGAEKEIKGQSEALPSDVIL